MRPQAPLPSSLGSERPVHTVAATSVRLKEGGTCRDTASRMQSHGSALHLGIRKHIPRPAAVCASRCLTK
jgi:hypothetical protein